MVDMQTRERRQPYLTRINELGIRAHREGDAATHDALLLERRQVIAAMHAADAEARAGS